MANPREKLAIPIWFDRMQDAVGIFANSNVDNNNDWLPIFSRMEHDGKRTSERRQWLESELKCKGLVTRMHFKFLWTYVGNVKNPQRKIIR